MTLQHGWLSRLARRLGLAPIPADAAEQLASLQSTVAALTQAQVENQAALNALREAVERTDKQLARAGKEQFKANALAEVQQRHLKTALDRLQEAEELRERELAELRERLANARSLARLELIRSLLPVLDGLDEALASGERVFKGRSLVPMPQPVAAGQSFAQRLSAAARLVFGGPQASLSPAADQALSPEAAAAWLHGLSLVRDRLLDLLAAEGVAPVEAVGEAFDPHRHVAVETAPAADGLVPGRIVRETRRGYVKGDTVLRYTEVVVAK